MFNCLCIETPACGGGQCNRALKAIHDGREAGWGGAAKRHQSKVDSLQRRHAIKTCHPGPSPARCLPRAARRPGHSQHHGVRAKLEGPGPPTQTSRSWGQGRSEAAAPHHLAVYREHTLWRTPPTFFFFLLFVILVKNPAVPLLSCVGASSGPSSYPHSQTQNQDRP